MYLSTGRLRDTAYRSSIAMWNLSRIHRYGTKIDALMQIHSLSSK